MPRVVHPPRSEHSRLRTPLTPGEELVFEFFDKHLALEWEIYLQPHLNGLRPDIVLLNPKVGIAVFEIKDWNLDALTYRFQVRGDQPPVLLGNKNGKEFPRE